MSVSIDSMNWEDCWFEAKDEPRVLAAFTKKVKGSYLGDKKHASIEKLAEDGSLYGISVRRDGDRIFLGDDNDRDSLGALEEAVRRLGPFMKHGAITVRAEGDPWKWVFKDGRVLVYDGRTIYEDELPYGYDNGDPVWTAWHLPQRPPPKNVWFEVDR